MNIYKIFILTFLLAPFCSISQVKNNNINFSIGYGINTYSMGSLNQFYVDSFAMLPTVDLLQNHIKKGELFYVNFSFQPNNHFDIGVNGSYQYGKSNSKPIFTETDDYGFPIKDHCGSFNLQTEAISVGISGTWYIDALLKWQEKENALNRFHFGVEVNGGIGFSKAIIDMSYPTIPEGSFYEFFTSKDFQGQIGLEAEYDITQSPIFTTLGIRLGYQYFRTKPLINRNKITWEVNNEKINLDFSGFYFGTYLKIGK